MCLQEKCVLISASERILILIIVAITGGIGCGKSTASAYISSRGIPCIDADAICHQLYAEKDPVLMKRLRENWGDRIFSADGSPDHKAMAEIVFRNDEELKKLAEIVQPLAFAETEKRLTAYRNAGEKIVLLDVPLLYECGWDKKADCVIAVWAPPEERLKRVQKYRGWSAEGLARREAKQMSAEEKLERADYGIINTGSRAQLEEECAKILDAVREKNKD